MNAMQRFITEFSNEMGASEVRIAQVTGCINAENRSEWYG